MLDHLAAVSQFLHYIPTKNRPNVFVHVLLPPSKQPLCRQKDAPNNNNNSNNDISKNKYNDNNNNNIMIIIITMNPTGRLAEAGAKTEQRHDARLQPGRAVRQRG